MYEMEGASRFSGLTSDHSAMTPPNPSPSPSKTRRAPVDSVPTSPEGAFRGGPPVGGPCSALRLPSARSREPSGPLLADSGVSL